MKEKDSVTVLIIYRNELMWRTLNSEENVFAIDSSHINHRT